MVNCINPLGEDGQSAFHYKNLTNNKLWVVHKRHSVRRKKKRKD